MNMVHHPVFLQLIKLICIIYFFQYAVHPRELESNSESFTKIYQGFVLVLDFNNVEHKPYSIQYNIVYVIYSLIHNKQ